MKLLIICCSSIFYIGCAGNAQTVQNTNTTATPTNTAPQRAERMQSTAVHTTENAPAPTPATDGTQTKWTQSGNPIDTAKFDGMIAVTQKALKAKPTDEAIKNAAAQAYFDRGFALTDARQYAAALGDYRKALKIEPTHEESKKWIEQIIGIYSMMKKDYPKEGEEPPALPFKSEKDKGTL